MVTSLSSARRAGFGQFLRTDPGLLAAYRERTGKALADMPRLVAVWRSGADSRERDSFTPAEAERWLLDRRGIDNQDVVELSTLAAIWVGHDHSRC